MRADATAERVEVFLDALGRTSHKGDRVYLSGGATAVLCGWRDSTRDIDLALEGDEDGLLKAISRLKDQFDTNVELAGPGDFLPTPAGWREQCVAVGQYGELEVLHVPFAFQVLAKLNRGFRQDLSDVASMLDRGLTDATEVARLFEQIRDSLYRFPTVDEARLDAAVAALVASAERP